MLADVVIPPIWLVLVPLACLAVLYLCVQLRRAVKLLESIYETLGCAPSMRANGQLPKSARKVA